MRRTPLIPLAAAAVMLLGTAFAPPANAATEEEVAGGLITPLSLAVAPDGTAYVAQNFMGTLTEGVPGGEQTDIYADEGGREVGAVSIEGDIVTFATTGMDHDNPTAHVYQLGPEGQHELADLFEYEKDHNPDGTRKYGILGLDKACKAKFTKHTKWLLPYKGIVESHPYATNVGGEGVTYVADAAANAVLAVSDAGTVSTVAVLPATKVTVKREFRLNMGLPKCTRGKTMKLEPVPTDVELGPDGNLYVTTLPGGPEDPSLGANGGIYKIAPSTGETERVAGDLVSPVGLAIAPNGTAYVSMLFASTILEIPYGGSPAPFAEVPFPGDVEVIDGYVYATQTDLMNDGSTAPDGKVLRWSTTG